ncbi:SRPBCC family protein [Pelagibacterium halotolerans]|uniref:SRPBCC family protein n=1 Tax=Pelagibacterium halotolerans TaxID=531813 RepID=UPI00384D25A5
MAKRTDTASRIIRAAPGAIYRAFVTPDAVASWLPPHGMSGHFEIFEPHPGGRFRMTLIYENPEGALGKASENADIVEARFAELIPGARMVWAVDFVSDDPAFAGTMTMTWALEPSEDGTRVTIRAENVPHGIRAEDHEAGLNSTLENLATYCE